MGTPGQAGRSGGEGGIRTPGTGNRYATLARWCNRPLCHLSGLGAGIDRTRRAMARGNPELARDPVGQCSQIRISNRPALFAEPRNIPGELKTIAMSPSRLTAISGFPVISKLTQKGVRMKVRKVGIFTLNLGFLGLVERCPSSNFRSSSRYLSSFLA